MRQTWLTILLALAVACSATASAWAAQACPFKATPMAAAMAHDCCPQKPEVPDQSPHHSKKMDCQFGQACRFAPAIAPQIPMLTVAVVSVVAKLPLVEQTGAPSSVLTGLWRPPRSI
jgi:hypothetical protein